MTLSTLSVDTVYVVIGILFVAALCHAGWNLLVKASRQSGPEFVWLYAAVGAPVSLVILVWSLVQRADGTALWAGVISMMLHTAYALVLQHAYGAGDFSIVYPVSRGAAPVLVVLLVIPWTGPPALPVWCGVLLAFGGIMIMDHRKSGAGAARSSLLGLAVAACIGAYTLWDAFALTKLGAPVLPYLAVGNLAQVILLTGLLAVKRRSLRPVVLAHWRKALPIAVLVPASYGLVLWAMTLEPVQSVATGRTLNVVVGTLLGVVALRERLAVTKIVGMLMIIGGVLLVAV